MFLQHVIAFSKDFLIFWKDRIDFQWRPRFFCHPRSFFKENRCFLVANVVFQ